MTNRSSAISVYINTAMCLGIIYTSVVYENNLVMLRNCKYILTMFCIGDIYGNSREMILHHIATIFLGYMLHIATYTELTIEEKYILSKATSVLMQTEISTLPLNMLHLGYKNKLMKLAFAISFFYVRIIRIPFYLVISPDTCYYCYRDEHPVEKLQVYYIWNFSILSLLGLNIMWMFRIIKKIS